LDLSTSVAQSHFGKQLLQSPNFVPHGKLLKCFVTVAVVEVDLEEFFQSVGQFRRAYAGEDLTANGLMLSESTANKNVVGILAVGLRSKAPNVAHVVLGARVGATGQMDVHWRIK
jgi:hypothetical protein